jgi:hypothetical protein
MSNDTQASGTATAEAIVAGALHRDGNPAASAVLTCSECRRTARIAVRALAAANLLALRQRPQSEPS